MHLPADPVAVNSLTANGGTSLFSLKPESNSRKSTLSTPSITPGTRLMRSLQHEVEKVWKPTVVIEKFPSNKVEEITQMKSKTYPYSSTFHDSPLAYFTSFEKFSKVNSNLLSTQITPSVAKSSSSSRVTILRISDDETMEVPTILLSPPSETSITEAVNASGERFYSKTQGVSINPDIIPDVPVSLSTIVSLLQKRGKSMETFQSNSNVGSLDSNIPLSDGCLNPLIANDPTPFTIRRASVERDLYSLVNPLGLIHPTFEFHHFAISGVYSSTNTYFLDFIVERVT